MGFKRRLLNAARYTAQAHNTCGGKAGSCGFEKLDAAQYAAWGV